MAGRAGVPIGSVYRFFPNKRAMAEALAQRNLDAYADRITARLTAPAHTPLRWRPAMDVVVDEYLAMKRTVPGFALVEFTVPRRAPPGRPTTRSPTGCWRSSPARWVWTPPTNGCAPPSWSASRRPMRCSSSPSVRIRPATRPS